MTGPLTALGCTMLPGGPASERFVRRQLCSRDWLEVGHATTIKELRDDAGALLVHGDAHAWFGPRTEGADPRRQDAPGVDQASEEQRRQRADPGGPECRTDRRSGCQGGGAGTH